MKAVTMFILRDCPYCREAVRWMEELKKENPAYAGLNILIFDEEEHADFANNFDYYYVPTYYVGGDKLHEGAATKEKVRRVLEAAL